MQPNALLIRHNFIVVKSGCYMNEGIYSSDPEGTRGGLQSLMDNCSSDETSVGMYKLKKAMDEFCSDLLATH
jgi:hypothetical protein